MSVAETLLKQALPKQLGKGAPQFSEEVRVG